MLNGRSWEDWIARYSQSHQNRWNQLTHTFGIPMIVIRATATPDKLPESPFLSGAARLSGRAPAGEG